MNLLSVLPIKSCYSWNEIKTYRYYKLVVLITNKYLNFKSTNIVHFLFFFVAEKSMKQNGVRKRPISAGVDTGTTVVRVSAR